MNINENKLIEMSKQGYMFMSCDTWKIDYKQTEHYCITCKERSKNVCCGFVITKDNKNGGYCSYYVNFQEPECLNICILEKELFTL